MADDKTVPESLVSETETFDAKSTINGAIQSILKHDAVIVNKGGSYFGIADSRTLYRSLQLLNMPKKQALEKFAVRVPRIMDNTQVTDAAYFFYKARTKALPYVKGGKVRGVITRATMIKMLLSLGKLSGIRVSEAMSNPLIAIDSGATITQAASAMRSNRVNRLAVTEKGKLAGLLTSYDIVKNYAKPRERRPELASRNYNPSNFLVSDIMQRNASTTGYGDSLSDVARVLIEKNISSVFVTKGGQPVGIVTELDIITGAVSKGAGEENKIFLSGLDSSTYEYEDEVRSMLKAFLQKIEKIRRVDVEYVSLVVRKFKSNSYELHMRLSMGKMGTINSHVIGHLFERTLALVIKTMENDVMKEKEKYLQMRNITRNMHLGEDE